MDHIAVIVVHYNTDKETRACLESLLQVKEKGFKLSVLVVDNASKIPLKLPQFLTEEKITVLRSEANLGFTGGNNLGISAAIERFNPNFFVLLNSDAVASPDSFAQMHEYMIANPKVGVAGPKIYFGKGYEFHGRVYPQEQRGSVIWYGGGTVDWPNLTAFHRCVDEVDYGQLRFMQNVDFVTGCCMMIKREVVETIGLLDDAYFLYFEDVDYSLRAIQAGYELGMCADAEVWHNNAGSSGGSGSSLHVYYQTRNRLLLASRYGSPKIKLTATRWALQQLGSGTPTEKRAILDLCLGKLGKQALV